MTSDQLHQIAASLRKVAADIDSEKMAQCAQLLKAAHGLNVLRKKVTPYAR